MNKVFSFLMVAFVMVAMMTSCDKDKDKDKDKDDDNNAATSTYKGFLDLSNKGDLKGSSLNVLYFQLSYFNEVNESATYKNVKPDDAKAAFSKKIEELASTYAQDYSSYTFTITAQLKDTNNNNNIIAEWVISCKKGVAEVKQKDMDAAPSTYKGFLELSDDGDLKGSSLNALNIILTLFSEVNESATYTNVKPDDAKAAFSQKIEELASKYAQDNPSNTFTITAQLKDINNNNNIIAEWVISCKNGVGEVEQK